MFGRGSVAASFVLIIVLIIVSNVSNARTPATIPQMFDRGSVAASFGLIIVSNEQELQQLYRRCLIEDQ